MCNWWICKDCGMDFGTLQMYGDNERCRWCRSIEVVCEDDLEDYEIQELIDEGIGDAEYLQDVLDNRERDRTWIEEGVKDLNKMYPREM